MLVGLREIKLEPFGGEEEFSHGWSHIVTFELCQTNVTV